MYSNFLKNLIDRLVSLILCIILFMPFIIISLIILFTSKGPIFFIQDRLGFKGKVFKIIKFRTMIDKKRETHNEIYQNDNELTSVGILLRKFKIDELPQLFNVLRGEMSLVGPRPALPDHINIYENESHNRLNAKPGMTGLAQVNGNIYLSWEERWIYDLSYIDDITFCNDIKIIFKTLLVILKGEKLYLKKHD